MKNLLFISTYPFPLDMGSKQHAYYFLKALSSFYHVYCIFFIPPHVEMPPDTDGDLAELDIRAYHICHFNKPPRLSDHGRIIRGAFAFPSNYMNLATHRTGLRVINEFIEKYAIDIVHFEHFWFTKYALNIHRHPRKVVVYHDLHHNLFLQLAKQEKKYYKKILHFLSFIKFYLFEINLNKKISLKIFLNPAEMSAFPKNSAHLPHIVNGDIIYNPVRATDVFNILFIGAYNHPPNRRSVKFIINGILPKLADMRNDFKIHIIGPGTEKFQNLLLNSPYSDYVCIHGFKQDINQAFEKMDIALFPILDGGGIKTKIIDALASGIPVVTTPKGVEGLCHLPDNCIGIGNSPDSIVNEVQKLMRDKQLRSERSEIGKSFIEKEHSFYALANKLKQDYIYL